MASALAYGRAMGHVLEVRRDDLSTTRVVDDPRPPVTSGQALLRIDRFGLTANNVTYAVTGDRLGYWRFFPAEAGWGRVPAWGFADVVASEVAGLDVGTRVFGYLPMATHLLVEPTGVRSTGFADGAEHRAPLPAPYNEYRRVDGDPLYAPDAENLQALLLPLFMTSFVLEAFMADNAWFGAEQVLMSSASAKTTIGTAMLASGREKRPRLVGLTSQGNVDFVRSLGCYDDVVTYGEIDDVSAAAPTTYVDVAGDAGLRLAVHEHLGDALRYSCAVGLSHWDSPAGTPPTGPAPAFFFAPSEVEKRVSEWGSQGYQQRLATAWTWLRARSSWLDVTEERGVEAAAACYGRLLAGKVGPSQATVVLPGG